MRRTSKIGLSLMCAGVLVWGIPTARYYYPTWNALKAPLPLTTGAVRHDTFSVRTSERYNIDLACQEVGQFKEAWKDFLNWKTPPAIACDISLKLLHDGTEIHSDRLRSLRPASWSAGTAFWHMARVELPSSGVYELWLTNHTDISYLQPTTPTLQVYLSGYYHKNVGTWSALGLFAGAPIFLVGLIVFVISLFR